MGIWRPDLQQWWVLGQGSGRWRRTAWAFRCARRQAGRPGGSPAGSASHLWSELPGPEGAAWQRPSFPLSGARWAERRPTPAAAPQTHPGSWFCYRKVSVVNNRFGISPNQMPFSFYSQSYVGKTDGSTGDRAALEALSGSRAAAAQPAGV